MPRRTHPSYIISIALGLVLVISAVSLIRQPHATLSSEGVLRRFTDVITPDLSWITPVAERAPQTFPLGSRVAGVDIGDRTTEEAAALVTKALAQWQQPVPLVTDTLVLQPATPTLDLRAFGVRVDVPALVAQASAQYERDEPVDVRWVPQIDGQQLRAALTVLAPQWASSAEPQFTFTTGAGGRATFRAAQRSVLDVEATAQQIERLLQTPTAPITSTVVLRTERAEGTLADLDAALQQQVAEWDGVAGVAVYDLETGGWLGINDGTVFDGASVLKVPILTYAYAKLGSLSLDQQTLAEQMILNSDNPSSNDLLAAGAGGEGIEAALEGAQEMTGMLQAVGLENTFMLVPYEAGDWLAVNGLLPEPLPSNAGDAPRTVPGDYLRTTPRDMAQFFSMVVQCADGNGPLLDRWTSALTPYACRQILALLKQPHDTERMMAGIPHDVLVAHKAGWLWEMQADVGIVYSPNRTYVAALYLWRDGFVTDEDASPAPYLGALSHTIYSFYNPQ